MKNKSPVKANAGKKNEMQAKSPIVKAKNNQASPKKNASPKKAFGTPKSPKHQNGNVQNGGGQKGKKQKPNKVPLMNEASDNDDNDSPAVTKVAKFGGTAALDASVTDQPKKGKKNKTPPQTTEDKETSPAKKAKISPEDKEKADKVKASKKILKGDGAKKKQGKQKRKIGLTNTLAELKHEKNLTKIREMLPLMEKEIEHLQKRPQPLGMSGKRKLRLLKSYKKKAESGNLEDPKPVVGKKQKKAKELLDMSQDDEEDNGETWVEKLNKAAKEDDEEDSDEEEEDDDDEEEKADKDEKKPKAPEPKKKRFVLFVGNLSYETSEEEIKQHFEKSGNILSVRIGKDKKTNMPKGFCHLELDSEEAYQKALSMNHTQLNKRRINVMFSQGTNEKSPQGGKKNNAKVKDMKLKGMASKGQLAGSTKDSLKRSARRKKAAAAKTE